MNQTNNELYQKFLSLNRGIGTLMIRANTAREALPVSNLKILITTTYEGNTLTLFEGYTDESGMINNISLPAPKIDNNNLIVPIATTYNIKASLNNQFDQTYFVNIYDGISALQNISVFYISEGDNYGN